MGPIIGRENAFTNVYTEGFLRESTGFIAYSAFKDTIGPDSILRSVTVDCSLLSATVDDDGNPSDFLFAYDRGAKSVFGEVSIKPFLVAEGGFDVLFERDSLPVGRIKATKTELSMVIQDVGDYSYLNGDFRQEISFDRDRPEFIHRAHDNGDWYMKVNLVQRLTLGGIVVREISGVIELPVIFTSPAFTLFDHGGIGTDVRLRNIEGALRDLNYAVYRKMSNESDGAFYAARSAVEGFQTLSINGIAFVRDLQALKEALQPLINLKRNPLSPKRWAQLLLWYKYGVKLSWMDTSELFHALSNYKQLQKSLAAYAKMRNGLQCRYGTYSNIFEKDGACPPSRISYHSRVTAQPKVPWKEDFLGGLEALLTDLDLKISATNLWDLVPFSFVVNWFVSVDEFMSNIDYRAWVSQMRVQCHVYSRHIDCTAPRNYLGSQHLYGELRTEVYDRYVSTSLPKPPLGLDFSTAFLSHWWEEALIFLSLKGR